MEAQDRAKEWSPSLRDLALCVLIRDGHNDYIRKRVECHERQLVLAFFFSAVCSRDRLSAIL